MTSIGPVEFYGPRDNCAGLFAVDFPWRAWQVTVHVLVRRSHSGLWGRYHSWFDGPLLTWGAGPFVLVCAMTRPT